MSFRCKYSFFSFIFSLFLISCSENPSWLKGDWFENSDDAVNSFNFRVEDEKFFYSRGMLFDTWTELRIVEKKKYRHEIFAINTSIDGYLTWIYFKPITKTQIKIFFSEKYEKLDSIKFPYEKVIVKYYEENENGV